MLMRVNKYDYQQPVVANQPSYNKTVINPNQVRYCGVVESLNVEKCFGFIYNSDFKDRLFFRTNGGVFRVGCKVNFSVSCSDRGPMAVDVKASFR
jgi:cold shock CspA family protein